MCSIRVFVLLPLLLCACGGGGGGGGINADQQAAIQLLEDCGLDAIGRYLQALDITVQIVDPNGTTLPAITVVNTNQAQGSITWNVDLTGDPAPEAFGVIQFQDDTGQPADPGFDITQFMANGLGALDLSLATLPDGWSVSITVNAPTQPLLNSRFIYAYTSGAVSGVTGTGNIQSVSCGTTFSFNGATLAELVAAFPTIDLTSTYTGGGTTLAGGTSLAGTDIATVDGKVNGGTTTYTFAADLGAGTVTAQ